MKVAMFGVEGRPENRSGKPFKIKTIRLTLIRKCTLSVFINRTNFFV